jgi:hypothetical protein
MIPTITEFPYEPQDTTKIIAEVLQYSLVPYHKFAPIFHIYGC